MNTAYRAYIEDAFDAYQFDNDGDRNTVGEFLNWLENEYEPNPNALHGATPEPDWRLLAAQHGEHPAIVLTDEDLRKNLDPDVYRKLSPRGRENLLSQWACNLNLTVRNGDTTTLTLDRSLHALDRALRLLGYGE